MTTTYRMTRLAAGLIFLAAVGPAFALSRTVTINAPARAVAGSKLNIVVTAATDAGNGEQVGFLHAEYSLDGGLNWMGFSFDANLGPRNSRSVGVTVGPKGSKVLVRARVAFRGGKAGDVDFSGAPIRWDGSWSKWESPPALLATIESVEPW